MNGHLDLAQIYPVNIVSTSLGTRNESELMLLRDLAKAYKRKLIQAIVTNGHTYNFSSRKKLRAYKSNRVVTDFRRHCRVLTQLFHFSISSFQFQLAISSFVYIADDTTINLIMIENYSKCTQQFTRSLALSPFTSSYKTKFSLFVSSPYFRLISWN